MKNLLFLLLIACGSVFAQDNSNSGPAKKPEMIGFLFNAVDFTTPVIWKDGKATRKLATPREMDYGISLSYWRGLKPKIDLAVKLNAMMHDYAGDRDEASEGTEAGFELEPTLNARVLDNNSFFSPFLTAGLGLGVYTGSVAAYAPMGTGLQFNFNGASILMLQANYRISLAGDLLKDHFLYSCGFLVNLK